MKNIFSFTDYKSYLKLRVGPKGVRTGHRAGLAKSANCNTTYVSQVLNGDRDFNLEQAERISQFLGHNHDENHYFLLLIQLKRAGSASLRDYFLKQVLELQNQRHQIKRNIGPHQEIAKTVQAKYYSSWQYAAVHVGVTIPQLQTIDSLAKYFDLPQTRVRKILDFLTSSGIVRIEKGRFVMGANHIHLGEDSEEIAKHHANWRLQSILSLERERKQDLHYSAAISISKSDMTKLREIMIDFIKKSTKEIENSKAEEVYGLNLDLFKLGRD